jgi:UDP-galactopyranose mutase
VDVLVVGAGFAGAILAERLASTGREVLVIDRRDHIAGNAYDHEDTHGVLVHRYGPHLFHTNSDAVFEYLSRFTAWRPYEHRVLVSLHGQLYPLPINQDTINQLYGLNLDEAGVERFLAGVREHRDPVLTSEDVVLNAVGRDLCNKIFRGYTRKQWGLELADLSASVLARIPTRTNRDDRYFTDKHQAMPAEGYTRLFERLLAHPRIRVETGVDFAAVREAPTPAAHGLLPGASTSTSASDWGGCPTAQSASSMSICKASSASSPRPPSTSPTTTSTRASPSSSRSPASGTRGTSIVKEFPTDEGDPYYPVPRPANQELYQRYHELAASETNVVFAGRLAQYRYYNMDQAARRPR